MYPQVRSLPTLALRIGDVVRLMRAASYAQVLQSKLRVEWVQDSGRIRDLYGALCGLFGTPGTAEVVLPDMTRAADEVHKLTTRRIDVFFDKCVVGPSAAADYLKATDAIRIDALATVRETFADTMAINREIARAWGVGVERLADVHLASTLVVKVAGAVLPGPAAMIDIGYSITVETVPTLFDAGSAKALAVLADEVLSTTIQEVGARVGERVVDAINGRSTEAELKQALRRLDQAENKLNATLSKIANRRQQIALGLDRHRATQSLRALEPRIERYGAQLNAAQKGVVASGAKRVAARGIGFVFLAVDVLAAFQRHAADVAAARQ